MSSSTTTLQLAQVLADLSTLQNTDPDAAHALLRANKTLSASRSQSRKARANAQLDGVEFDDLGRRVKAAKPPGFSRQSSSLSGSGTFSGAATPGANGEVDEDILKAEELVMLYGMRGKFKQMGDTGLMRARERVDAVVEKYSRREYEEKERHSGKI